MNYKAIGLGKLVEYAEEREDLTLGQVIYSFLRKPISGLENNKQLMEISDEDMYTIIEKAEEAEKETKYFTEDE